MEAIELHVCMVSLFAAYASLWDDSNAEFFERAIAQRKWLS